MFCHFCGNQLPESLRRILYCPDTDCKSKADSARKDKKSQRICRLCGRGTKEFNRALWNLYRACKGYELASIPQVAFVVAEIDRIRAKQKQERDARRAQKAVANVEQVDTSAA